MLFAISEQSLQLLVSTGYYTLLPITRCLQGKTVDLIKAFRDIEAIKQDYKVLRAGVNDEFQRIYEHGNSIA